MRKFEPGKTASHLIFYIGTCDWPNLSFGSLAYKFTSHKAALRLSLSRKFEIRQN